MAETTHTPSMARPAGATNEPRSTLVHQAEGQAQRVVAETKELGSEVMAAVRDSATVFYEEQRDRAATEIAAVGNLLRSSVQLLDRNGGTIGHYADDAATQLNDFAGRLRTRSWSQLCGDVETFARSNPMIFIAAAVGAGFVGARLLAASANQPVGETPMQSSMRGLKDTGGQIRDALRSEPAPATASTPAMATPGTATPGMTTGGTTTGGSAAMGAPKTSFGTPAGTTAGTTGGPTGRH
ncbi:MAG: hypothetical protein ACM3JG_13215 [Thiohalocapsa sp.]